MMNGQPFGLPTDVFTLGILLAEIAARKVVDSKTFQVRTGHRSVRSLPSADTGRSTTRRTL